jgi:hypothetical protein
MLQETMAEWWDEARRKGHEEGRQEGKAEGKAELEAAVLKIALNLKQSGFFSTEQIAELTGLSVNDIDTLAWFFPDSSFFTRAGLSPTIMALRKEEGRTVIGLPALFETDPRSRPKNLRT